MAPELSQIRSDLNARHDKWLSEQSRLQVAAARSICLITMLLVTGSLMFVEAAIR